VITVKNKQIKKFKGRADIPKMEVLLETTADGKLNVYFRTEQFSVWSLPVVFEFDDKKEQ